MHYTFHYIVLLMFLFQIHQELLRLHSIPGAFPLAICFKQFSTSDLIISGPLSPIWTGLSGLDS